MKIVIFAHAFAPTVGGAQTYIMNLARGLTNGSETPERKTGDSSDFEVTVATSAPALGFDDYVFGEGVSLIEWADRYSDLIPKGAKWISFELKGENSRVITESKRP